ncbi:hypothetical protein [Halorientalis sp.]|jgi:hypothetical protein|uniref:hypothetical protein n=1 Tax=Halorientalis sp. TaxID=1931229 RepID=UPI002605C2B3|nr:hypothetical protein [Halorientalis sp.]
MRDLESQDWTRHETAQHMAEQICLGFQAHDRKQRDEAIEAFGTVDSLQFSHIDIETATHAATAYVEALWAKDDTEVNQMADGEIDPDKLADADWESVREKFRERASIVGMNPRYAELSTTAWRNHKTGRDYWTPIQRAQAIELRAAMSDGEYPRKPRYGQSGFGPEAARYALAVELHDMHTDRHWQQATDVMVPYFKSILEAHD